MTKKESKPKTINGVNYESKEDITEKEVEILGHVAEIITDIVVESNLNPEKHKTFLRLAKPRTQKVLDAFRILGNCSNKSSYAYTEAEINKIFETIYNALGVTEQKFKQAQTGQKELFEF